MSVTVSIGIHHIHFILIFRNSVQDTLYWKFDMKDYSTWKTRNCLRGQHLNGSAYKRVQIQNNTNSSPNRHRDHFQKPYGLKGNCLVYCVTRVKSLSYLPSTDRNICRQQVQFSKSYCVTLVRNSNHKSL